MAPFLNHGQLRSWGRNSCHSAKTANLPSSPVFQMQEGFVVDDDYDCAFVLLSGNNGRKGIYTILGITAT